MVNFIVLVLFQIEKIVTHIILRLYFNMAVFFEIIKDPEIRDPFGRGLELKQITVSPRPLQTVDEWTYCEHKDILQRRSGLKTLCIGH